MRKYRFSDFELDLAAFELRRRGEPVKLERRPMDLLVLLLNAPGRMVPREEIVAALWPTRVVIDFEAGLNTLVRKVRHALGDSPEQPQFIETVPGRGYRFIAPVVAESQAAPQASRTSETRPVVARKTLWIAGSFALLLAVGVSIFVRYRNGTPPPVARIAVLPFKNLTGDASLAYLAMGLAEDTGITLAQIDPTRLRVIGVATWPPVTVEQPYTEIGRRLGVDYLVQSSLRAQGPKIRVTSQLLRTKDSELIWSGSIDRELTNVLGLQRELGIAISEQIRMHLSPEFATAIARRRTQNPEAYALYLKGRFEWLQLTPASIRRATEYFGQATRADPDYALGWAGLAFTLITSTRTADADPATVTPIARQALQRALELGPNLAETWYAQGYYSLFLDLDARAAVQAARKAVRLDPNNAQAHMLLGVSLPLDRQVEAREMLRRARELDPMFALAFANSALLALRADEIDRALDFATQAIAINPEFWVGYLYLGRARSALGDSRGALQAFADAMRYSGGHSLIYKDRARELARLGRSDEIRALLEEIAARSTHQYFPSYAMAVIHNLLGERDAAFQDLERAIDARENDVRKLPTDPALKSLHDDPRFVQLLRRCGCASDR